MKWFRVPDELSKRANLKIKNLREIDTAGPNGNIDGHALFC
ncbi:MAG: hypothetical protein ACOX86_06835 [Pelotomaculaceae bacterium]|nr:hypothetical protein [Bacillota bacterium]